MKRKKILERNHAKVSSFIMLFLFFVFWTTHLECGGDKRGGDGDQERGERKLRAVERVGSGTRWLGGEVRAGLVGDSGIL